MGSMHSHTADAERWPSLLEKGLCSPGRLAHLGPLPPPAVLMDVTHPALTAF